MKYCQGRYHGEVDKRVDDDENFCTLCEKRMAFEKEEKSKKRKELAKKIGKGILAVAPAVIMVGSRLISDKGGDA